MNKSIIPFIITFIAGISTLIGIIPTYINNKYKNYIIKTSIILSGLIMLIISVTSLIPESIKYLNINNIQKLIQLIVYILTGIAISKSINSYSESKTNNKLLKIGILSTIVLIIHNIPEGIITYITSYKNIHLGIKLSLAIALHNIPEGIIISIPLYYSTNSRKKALLYTSISGFSELFGAILAKIFLNNITNKTLGIILAITAGIMIYISIFELLLNIKIRKQIF